MMLVIAIAAIMCAAPPADLRSQDEVQIQRAGDEKLDLVERFEAIEWLRKISYSRLEGLEAKFRSDLAKIAETPDDPRAEEARRLLLDTQGAHGIMVVDLGNGVSMRLVEIKPGRFMMGSPESESGRNGDETRHEVRISKPFWLGQTEVTQAQWQAVMGSNPSHFTGDLNRPVESVSWNDAVEFCSRLSQKMGMTFRLPTEAEWEYACRAGTTTAYSFGDDPNQLGDYGWFGDNSGRTPLDADEISKKDRSNYLQRLLNNECRTHAVKGRLANAWGLFDMHGNVWEWCSDWYGTYPSGSVTDPTGPSTGSQRVLRGGSWGYLSRGGRAAYRSGDVPGVRNFYLGFRVARTP